jgi:hypothetical protein
LNEKLSFAAMPPDLIRPVSLTMCGSSSTLARATVMSAGDCSDLSSDMAVYSVTVHERRLRVRSFYSNAWSLGWQMAINRDAGIEFERNEVLFPGAFWETDTSEDHGD